MRRALYWMAMCALSIANGLLFFQMTLALMRRGIEGVDNQGALLMMPLFWLTAAVVLLLLNLATLVDGRHIAKGDKVDPFVVFRFQGLSGRGIAGRAAFLVLTAFLVYLAFHFDLRERLLSAAYAVTGGLLLVLLYGWRSAAVKRRRG